MSKELNKAPVEQAGGDERAAFEAWLAQAMSHKFDPEFDLAKYEDSGEYRYNPAAAYWKAWQARAALAQPSPVRSSLLINGYQLRAALDFIAPDGTAEQLKSEACIEWRQQDADFLEAGLYAFCAEYPEEGGVLLDEEPTTAQPSPLQSEQAEAERPEVVARVVHSNPVVLGQCGPLNANDELMTVAQHAASVARWAEMFNRVEQERDVALARVAELERQEPVDVPGPGPDEIHQMAFEEGQPAEDGDGYLFSAEEFDLFVQRLLDSCATPVAWAQHSVPDGAPPKGVLTVPDIQATYIEVSAEVRYWEDAKINGVEDENGTLTPFRSGNLWCPVIRLEDGTVMDWPAGMVADFHFKVCDAGQYWLLDDSRKRVAQWAGYYVPDEFLCPTENGYGDYIIFKVGADGLITGWRKPEIEWGGREDDQEGWKRLKENDRA